MLTLFLALGAVAAASPLTNVEASSSANGALTNPIVNLGSAGSYKGVVQNDGTVVSWKGIPYASPPIGSLRFMPPEPLETQNPSIIDVTTDALRCVQFARAPYGVINSNIVGSKAGPGQEDCLKLWIWKPANVSVGAKLPVMFYIHGGGLQTSAAPNNDFSDWVGQSQNFIAVNVAYRLGVLGFMAHPSLPSANAGLLDQRLGLQWVKQNIAAFGGNPDDITIMAQSGGGYAVVAQMALYDGDTQGLFQKAIPRSIQRSPMFTVDELSDGNAEYFRLLNCTTGQDQLNCFKHASVPAIVNAYTSLSSYKVPYGEFQNLTFGSSAAYLPMIDGVTLTNSITRLFKSGKTANVPTIAGATNDEGGNSTPRNMTIIDPSTTKIWNLTDEQVSQAASLYLVNETFGSSSPDNFFTSGFKAYIQGGISFGEQGLIGSERLVGRHMSESHGADQVWTFRFNAPIATNYTNPEYPLSWVAHSADNSYLQNSTSVMTPFEKSIALEWRAYLSSFIRTGNPNTERLLGSPAWPTYGALNDIVNSPVRLVPQFKYSSNADENSSTSTQVEVSQRAQLERVDWWLSDALLESTRM